MLPVFCSRASPPSRFTYGGGGSTYIADSLNLKPVARPAFILPKGINAEAEQELKTLHSTVRGYTSFSEELLNQNPNDEFGETCESAIRTCDFTLGGETDGLEIAFSLEWQCLTQCDMGSFTTLYRTVKKSKPAVLLDCGCGENSGCEKEATEKQMKAMLKRLGLKKASAVELLAVLLFAGRPGFPQDLPGFRGLRYGELGGRRDEALRGRGKSA